jgi:hypothetical protein
MITPLTIDERGERPPRRRRLRGGHVLVAAAGVLIILAGIVWLADRERLSVEPAQAVVGADPGGDLQNSNFDDPKRNQPLPDGVADLTGVRLESSGTALLVKLEHNVRVVRPGDAITIEWNVSLKAPGGGYRIAARWWKEGINAASTDLWSSAASRIRIWIEGRVLVLEIPARLLDRLDRITEISANLDVRASRQIDELVFTTDLWSDRLEPVPVGWRQRSAG